MAFDPTTGIAYLPIAKFVRSRLPHPNNPGPVLPSCPVVCEILIVTSHS